MSSREERRRRSSPGVVTIAPMSDPNELPGIGKALSAVPAQNCEKKISVGIVGGNRLLREYLSTSIKSQADVTCSLSASGFSLGNPPDVTLVEYHDANRTTVTQLLRLAPTTKLVVLNADSEGLNVVECVRLGFVGFILKDAGLDDVMNTIRTVLEGKSVIPAAITIRLCRQLYDEQRSNGHLLAAGSASITSRERQVMALVVEGLTNKEIADRLNVATHTVKSHLHNLLQKFKLRKRVDLVSLCLRDQHLRNVS